MKNKVIRFFLVSLMPLVADPSPTTPACSERIGSGSAYSSYHSMATSMMVWGTVMAVAIAGLSVWLSEGTSSH